MKLIVTHEQPDFDALASLALARLAHPGATAVVSGAIGPRMRDVIRLYRDELDLEVAGDIDPGDVSELIVVDTNDAARIAPFDSLVGRVPVTVYDHHAPGADVIPAAHGVQDRVGATATILVRHLQASNVPIPASIATLALLGIHEDTGGFAYSSTRADDHSAAAFLLKCGASLELVVDFASDPLTAEQRGLLEKFLERATTETDGQRSILTVATHRDDFVPGISGVVSQLLNLFAADAALVAVGQPGHTLVFARVARGYDASAAFTEAFGTAGHPGAAFARTPEPPEQALGKALASLRRQRTDAPTAAQLMSSPVVTVAEAATVAEALQVLRRHGHNGAPVVDGQGHVVGVLSRRDLEHALGFDLGDAAATGFMNRQVITAGPDDTLQQLEARLIEHAIGRLPIIDGNGNLLGIVSRSDLLRARHAQPRPDEAALVLSRLPARARQVVDAAAEMIPPGARLYLVGGMVRDALLGRSLSDVDLAVEGTTASRLAADLQERFGGEASSHDSFGTTTLMTGDGLLVDIAGTRRESYAHPGALPQVTPGTIARDLLRRDYTVNAMAVRVSPAPPELLDPTGGLADLRRGTLRLLHPLSFAEDPTRLLRGARLAARLGFEFGTGTLRQARLALLPHVLDRVAPARLRHELELALREPRMAPTVRELDRIGALRTMFGLADAPALLAALDEHGNGEDTRAEAALLALLLESAPDAAAEHLARFNWPLRLGAALERLRQARTDPDGLTEELLGRMSAAEHLLVRCFGERHRELADAFAALPERRRLRGSDVLGLGVPAGPLVGRLLSAVAHARQAGRVSTFEAELELAKSLLAEERTVQRRDDNTE